MHKSAQHHVEATEVTALLMDRAGAGACVRTSRVKLGEVGERTHPGSPAERADLGAKLRTAKPSKVLGPMLFMMPLQAKHGLLSRRILAAAVTSSL